MRRTDRTGRRIDETNMERRGITDAEMVMGYASPEDYGGPYEEAVEASRRAWEDIKRGYFAEHLEDFDAEAMAREYERLTVRQAPAGGHDFVDLVPEALNKLAQHYRR